MSNLTNKEHILLIEDDQRLADLIKEYLEKSNFLISHETRGDLAVSRIITEQPDLVILDLMLPGLDGLNVYKQVQSQYVGAVLILSAKDEDIDQIIGLELGADDYVIKPVEPRVLLARVNALLRRQTKFEKNIDQTTTFNFGSLQINQSSRQAILDQKELELTSNEFDLLYFLCSHAGEIMGREEILLAVRKIDYDGLDRWVDIRISRLRNKLGDNSVHPNKIKTIWGKGYLFVKDAW